jgi:hypothetical protein
MQENILFCFNFTLNHPFFIHADRIIPITKAPECLATGAGMVA